MLEHAEKYDKCGDEENAYIFYGRYLKILSSLQIRADYTNQKDYIKKMLGGNVEQQKIMRKMELLSDSLKQRYDRKKMLLENVTAKSIEVPTSMPKKTEVRHSITCYELYEMMEKESSRFLIIDCRPESDFQKSKICFNFQCNVPEYLCCIGMTVGKVQDKLPNESKVFWEMRKNRPIIVFVDWFSSNFARNAPIWHLKNILLEWDQELSEKNPEMIVLEGGYDRWVTTYPMKCTDPHIKSPKDYKNNISSPCMDDIEYPSVDDIVMKDQSMDSSSIPTIDRTTKDNAMKAYETKNFSQSDLLERKEQLMNKSIQNNKELIKLENDYSRIISNKENQESLSSQQDLLYRIYEMHTKQKDVELENESIEEDLKYAKTEPIKPSEKSKIEDLESRLKLKSDEQNKMKQEALLKVKAREEALEKARLSKPKFDSPIKPSPRKTELILSPRNLNQQNSTPRIDRASKPISINNQNFYDSQDFSPVYGKVASIHS